MKLVFEELSVPLAIPLSIFVLQISLISFDEWFLIYPFRVKQI